jgi:hypothetical protein
VTRGGFPGLGVPEAGRSFKLTLPR